MLIPTTLLLMFPALLDLPAEEGLTNSLVHLPQAAAAQAAVAQMPWQRNLEDALALSKATGKPLLICVNADGESASERLAANQYRDPAFIKLAKGFIPVLASPARHRARDFDDFGGRLADPKFGRVVESEHLEIEPLVYKRYFKGRRVAPRHVGVSPDGEILFDLFLLNNLSIISSTLREHGVFDQLALGGATGMGELLASPAHADRLHLEAIFSESSLEDRVALVGLALSPTRMAQHPQLVRLALASESHVLRLSAADAVLKHPSAGIQFMMEAYRVAEGDRGLQLRLSQAMAAVDTAGMTNVQRLKLRRQQEVLSGLSRESDCLNKERWDLALRLVEKKGEQVFAIDVDELTDSLGRIESQLRNSPRDAALHQLHARALLSLAKCWISDGGGNPTHVLVDARVAAEKALALNAQLPLASAVLAQAAYLSSDLPRAKEAASLALPGLHSWAGEALTSDVLNVFALLKAREVFSAYNNQTKMSAEAIADVCAAHELLLRHPLGTADQAIAYLNFLNTIGASSREEVVVRRALGRFSDNGTLHGYLRHYVLRDRGAAGMENAYENLMVPKQFALDRAWYAALSVLVAAERHALEGRRSQSMAAYRISIRQFMAVLERNPEYAESSNHYIGMAHAGMARQLTDAGELDAAMAELRAAAVASVSCFGDKDGLDRIPKKTLAELNGLLRGCQRSDAAEQLATDLKGLGLEL